jgi:hypothetical protein
MEEQGLWKYGAVQIFRDNPNKWKLSGMGRASPDKTEGVLATVGAFKNATIQICYVRYISVIVYLLLYMCATVNSSY